MLQEGSIFVQSPSFNSYSSGNFAEIAAKVCEEFVDDREELGLEPVVVVHEEDEEKEEISEQKELESIELQTSSDDLIQEKQLQQQAEEDSGDETDEDDFEFTFLCRDPDGSPISADEIFANGQIRPVFPVFNRDLLFAGGKDDDSKSDKNSSTLRVPLRKLFIGEREEESTDIHSSSSSEADELENLPAGTYCVWTPKGSSSTSQASPDTCKKSKSTGSSSSRRWRFRDFLFRSNSDGKDTFVFLTPSASTKMKKKDEKLVTEKVEKVEVSDEKTHSGVSKITGKGKLKAGVEVSPHEMHYVRNRALKENDRRRSYLPYRQDLVGFFANVNGLNRNLHPF